MLEPLKIVAFKDDKFLDQVGEYALQINPESYAHNHATEWKSAKNTQGQPDVKFDRLEPQTLSFTFFLDATGILPGSDNSRKKYAITSIVDEIAILKKIAYSLNGEIHTPNFLMLFWGKLKFKCRLSKLDIDYTLFKPSGIPLRAKLNVSFKEYLSPEDANKQKSSPDLTHSRLVVAGDSLPLMCHRIYGDSRYYLEVARVNRLTDFRNLEPGAQIIFPPLKP